MIYLIGSKIEFFAQGGVLGLFRDGTVLHLYFGFLKYTNLLIKNDIHFSYD